MTFLIRPNARESLLNRITHGLAPLLSMSVAGPSLGDKSQDDERVRVALAFEQRDPSFKFPRHFSFPRAGGDSRTMAEAGRESIALGEGAA